MNEQELLDKIESITSLKKLVQFFHEQGVKGQLTTSYDGQGDSGSINSFDYDRIASDNLHLEIFEDQISNLVYDLLPPGWEINEGSSGEIIIDFDTQKISIDHNWNITSTENESFEY